MRIKKHSLFTFITALAVSAQIAMAQQYTVVDTGQTTCYDSSGEIVCPAAGESFCGQDAQHTGNSPTYTVNGDGTISDQVTGLMWLQSPDTDGDGDIDADDKLIYDEAVSYPDTLNAQEFAGYTDWRLPTIKELYSLIDFRGVDPSGFDAVGGARPFIDSEVFDFAYGDVAAGERIIDAQFASSTLYVSTTMGGNRTMFGVNFADGRIKGYPADRKGFYVLLVRGNPEYGRNRFRINDNATITDNTTGLMWSQDDSSVGLDWQNALAWVEQRNAEGYLGYSDWRLPNAKELQSLVDYGRSPDTTGSAAIDPVFHATSITNEAGQVDYPCYWTGTTHARDMAESGTAAVYVAFGRAMGYMNGRWIDVHGAGAQRSDPKEGDPADFPFGRGPQGDAIRIYNYVRLVRTADGGTPTDLAIPAAARVQGSGAFFTSRIDAFNASDDAMSVDVVYTPRTDMAGNQLITSLTLGPNQMATVDDPLGSWFYIGDDEDTVGSLMFSVTEGSAADLMVFSVVTAINDDDTEYGQAFPATTADDALAAGETAYLATTVDGTRTRVNLGAMAWADDTVIEVRPVDPADTALATAVTRTIDFGESFQINDAASSFSLGESEDYLLEATVTTGSAVFYASVLDGNATSVGTSDPTTIHPVTAGAETVTLLELGPVEGYDDFSGSASVSNLSDTAAQVAVDFHQRGVAGVAATASLDIPIGDTVGFDDIVGELFGMTDVGTVVIRSLNGTQLMATGREFSFLFDEQDNFIGTAGQLIPGMTNNEFLQPGTTYHLLGLRQLEIEDGRERSHVAAFNPGDDEVELALTLYDGSTGASEGQTSFTVAAGELVQTNNIISVINPDQDGAPKRLELTTDGDVFVKAFRVNPTGDPVTIDALTGTVAASTLK